MNVKSKQKNHLCDACVRDFNQFQQVKLHYVCLAFYMKEPKLPLQKQKKYAAYGSSRKQKSQNIVTILHLYGVILLDKHAAACVKTICIVEIRRQSNSQRNGAKTKQKKQSLHL